MKKKNQMTLKRACQIATILKFGFEPECDELSLGECMDELRRATNRLPESQTLKIALETLRAEHIRNRDSEMENETPQILGDEWVLATPHITRNFNPGHA